MINKNELKGNIFKKELGLYKCNYQYHNKNKNSGNFGLSFYLKETFNENTDFSLCGDYNKEGEILYLTLDSIRIGQFIIIIPIEERETIKDLIVFLKKVYNDFNKEGIIRDLKNENRR